MTAQFERITRRTVAEEVRDALVASIERGELAPGSLVPTEQRLCEQFVVARTSVREAIQGLISLGLIERRGNRTYVAQRPSAIAVNDARKQSVTEIFELRRLVEVPIAELAATRADADQRQHIGAIAELFTDGMSLEAFRDADRRFHATVAEACRNAALTGLYRNVLDVLFQSTDFDSLLSANRNQSVVRRVIHDSIVAHREIAERIARGDSAGARRSAEAHLGEVEALMLAQMT